MSNYSNIIGEVEVICPRCKHNRSYKRLTTDGSAEFGECIACGELTYNNILRNPYAPPVAKCPYCNSTNTRKISTLSKAGSVAMWGVFALGKVSKEWHCNNCKSDF